MAKYRRYRKCPQCNSEYPASHFKCLTLGANWNKVGRARRQCPSCHYVGDTTEFIITSDSSNLPFAIDLSDEAN